jgi:hypothetical protein
VFERLQLLDHEVVRARVDDVALVKHVTSDDNGKDTVLETVLAYISQYTHTVKKTGRHAVVVNNAKLTPVMNVNIRH